LKCLLSIHSMFAECESYHVHSQLYLEPYIIWIQSVPVENLNNLAVALEKVISY
jgi:SHQ1 protein